MRKKYLSALLFGALLVTSAGTFTSCKDYDDDINNLQEQINTIKTDLENLKSTVEGLDGVKTLSFADGTLIIETGKGTKVEVPVPSATGITNVELKDNILYVDGVAKGEVTIPENETIKVEVKEDGKLYINDQVQDLEIGSKVVVTENPGNGTYTMVVDDKEYVLPMASSSIYQVVISSPYYAKGTYTGNGGNVVTYSKGILIADDYCYTQDMLRSEAESGIWWGAAASDLNDWTGTLGSIKKGQLLLGPVSSLTINVTPATMDLSKSTLKLVDSKGNVAPVDLYPVAIDNYEDDKINSGSRAASNMGDWYISVVPTATTENMGNAYTVNNKNVMYALSIDGKVQSGYNIVLDTRTNTEVNNNTSAPVLKNNTIDNTAKLYIGDSQSSIQAFTSVKIGKSSIYYADPKIADIQVDIAAESIDDAELLGISIDKTTNTLIVSEKAGNNTEETIKLNVTLLGTNGKKSETVSYTINSFAGTTVNDKVTLATTNYTLTPSTADNAKNIIINMEDVFSSLTADQSTDLTTVAWTVDNNFLVTSVTPRYFASEADAKENKDNKVIKINDNDAGRVRSIKYAVIPLSSYANTATAGEHKLNIVLSTSKGQIKKVVVPVNIVVPAFTDIFPKAANQWNGDTFATTLLSESTNKTVLGYATAFNKTTGTAYSNIKVSYAKVDNKYIVTDNTALTGDAKVELTRDNIVNANTGALKATTVSTTVTYSFSNNITTKYTFTTEIHSIFEGPELVYYKDGAIVETAEVGANGIIAPLSYKNDGTPVTGLAIKFGKDVKPFKADQAVDGITLKNSPVSDTNIQVYTKLSVKDVQSALVEFDSNGSTVTGVNQGTLVATFTDANGVKTKAEIPFIK